MAHFAELDKNNKVIRVVVVADAECMDNGVESEAKGAAFCNKLLGGRWVQTSFNGSMRGRFASTGFTYDAEQDVFVAPAEKLEGEA